jgi:DNA-repair protein complementing XP-A cells
MELTEEQLARIEKNKIDALKRREKSGEYIDYNLSTLKDSKGGFLFPEIDKNSKDSKRLKKENPIVYPHSILPSVTAVDPSNLPRCEDCTSPDIDLDFLRFYKVKVCAKCKETLVDKYTQLTKTEVKEDYLLTDEELRDTERAPFWEVSLFSKIN